MVEYDEEAPLSLENYQFEQLLTKLLFDPESKAGSGFDPHRYRDMEIISHMIEGELEHQDSMGNQDVIRVGEVQRMTAGTGILYSDYNPSNTSANHFLQI